MSQAIRSYKFANDSLSVEVVPEIGGKIVSLRNIVTGREWMWRLRLDAPLFRNEPTDLFDASPLIGADECLPTIARFRWNDLDLPDHGNRAAECAYRFALRICSEPPYTNRAVFSAFTGRFRWF
jgi:hypothetical protein